MSVQKSLRTAHTSSILISLVVNGLLIAALFTFITISDQQDQRVSTVMVMDPVEQEEIDEPEEEPEEVDIEDLEDLEVFDDFTMEDPLNTEIDPVQETVDQPTDTSVNNLSELMSDISSPVQMRGLMIGRSSAGRQSALRQYGRGLGGVSEPAVMNALRWLKRVQNSDGSWSKELGKRSNAGITGLALLTFLAHGETPSSKEFGPTVSKGIRFLVENQDAEGIFQPAGSHTSYGHAMATYAMAEAYTMTENFLFKEPLERGIKVIIDGQQENGGYDYEYKKGRRNDISVGAWNVQALKAALIALDRDPRVSEYLQRAMDGMLEGSVEKDGYLSFGYSVNGDKVGNGGRRIISAAGLLGLHLSGRGDSNEAKDVMKFMEQFSARDALPEWGVAQAGSEYGGEVMFWYYAVQAYFQEDRTGRDFGRFYPSMVKALVKNQKADGHWMCFTDKGKNHGPVFNTTMGALGLMVTYRYLPTTQAENIMPSSQQFPGSAPAEEEGVTFEI